jgi:iron complex transport system substrate-binding protein
MKKNTEVPGLVLPGTWDITRRDFLAGGAAAILLGGCGGSGDETSSSGETRRVEHFAGTTEVPAEPERVVALGGIYLANLISLGITPVAAGDDTEAQLGDVEELLPEDLEIGEIERIGDPYEPNIEAIAATEPDLIVGDEFHEEVYDQLSGIAPTVLVEYISNGGWRERFPDVAEAVGRANRIEEAEAGYEETIRNLPGEVRNSTVAFIRPDVGQFRIDSLPSAFPGSVAEDAGIPTLEVPEGVGELDEGSGFVTVSDELLDVVAAADLIVVPDFRSLGEDSDSVSRFERNPLWERLPAVRERKVLQIPGLVYNGGNHYAAEALLREIEDAIT